MIERYRQNLLKKNRTIKPKPGELDALMDEYMPGERQKRQQASEEVKLKGDSEVKD